MHSGVVGWAPVPNARAGSITTAAMPGGGSCQLGPIHNGPIQGR